MGYGYLLFHALVVLLAAGMQNLFYMPGVEQVPAPVKTQAPAPVKSQISAPVKTQTPDRVSNGSTDRYRQPENGEKEIKYIENPLPLPKKHEKKSMGYKFEVPPEKMKYDIQVSDADDFDLK